MAFAAREFGRREANFIPSVFVADVARNFDESLAPHIFQDFANELIRRAAALQPRRVLELSAGTGYFSRKLRDALPPDTELVITDLDPDMLNLARSKFRPGENVYFDQVDATNMGFPAGSFDLVICQLGVMFFPDKPNAFAGVRHVLEPSGTFLFNTWSPMAQNPFSQIVQEGSARFFPALAPPRYYNQQFSYSDPFEISKHMTLGGFDHIDYENVDVKRQVHDFRFFAHGLVHGSQLIDEIRGLRIDETEVVHTIKDHLIAAFPDGIIPMRAILFEAWV